MAEKSKGKSKSRSYLAKKFINLGDLESNLPSGLSLKNLLIGIGVALLTTALIVDYEFQSIPDYQVGDIADRTVEAPQDFTMVDEEATLAKRAEALEEVPAVFSFDVRVLHRLTSELRMAFADARELLAEEKRKRQIAPEKSLPADALREITPQVERMVPRLSWGKTIRICLKYYFSENLEDQLVGLLDQVMRYPGVVDDSKEVLFRYQNRDVILQQVVTGERETLSGWQTLRDVEEAQDLLRQQEYELTLVSGEEKKELISFLERLVVPNIYYNDEATRELERRALAEVDEVQVQIKRGKTIIRAGDEITERNLRQLQALKALTLKDRWLDQMIGVFLIALFFYFVLFSYFESHLLNQQDSHADYLLLCLVLGITLGATRLFVFLAELVAGSLRISELQDPVHFYFFAPVALGALLTVLLVRFYQAVLFSILSAVFIGLMTGEGPMIIYSLTGSLIAIYSLKQYRERSALIRSGLVIAVVNVLVALALQLISTTSTFDFTTFLVRSSGGLVSGLFAAMLTSIFLPSLESLFGLTTDIRLLELSNLNNPILRRLALEAPGTYHHSITVGTLAEAGAESIEANTLLIRVGAYYHDVGKLKHPEYYVENQIYSANKHESLSPTMSSLILASHVKDGLAIAEEVKLGPKVADLIPQHHGTRVMTFFYQKAREAAEDKNIEVSENDFRYPGPKPQSKEAAILMLADQVEAAARTLQDPTPGQIRSLIHRIAQATIQDGQLDECDITLKELGRVAHAFERVLTGMYHHRIEYPGFNFNKQQPIEGRRPEDHSIQ